MQNQINTEEYRDKKIISVNGFRFRLRFKTIAHPKIETFTDTRKEVFIRITSLENDLPFDETFGIFGNVGYLVPYNRTRSIDCPKVFYSHETREFINFFPEKYQSELSSILKVV
jgi:hypothetical protein